MSARTTRLPSRWVQGVCENDPTYIENARAAYKAAFTGTVPNHVLNNVIVWQQAAAVRRLNHRQPERRAA